MGGAREAEAGVAISSRGNPTQPVGLPWSGHKFSGDINGLRGLYASFWIAFLLASIACFLYPVVCLASERPWP
jgi:hypothetical protein